MTGDLQHVKRVELADVHKAGRHAARLVRTPHGTRFGYVDDYDGPPVSFSLPREAPPWEGAGGAVPAFFAGLLPEGRRLTALRRSVKTSEDDELSLLLAVGADLVGDVQVVPAGEPVPDVPPSLEVASFADVRFRDLFAAEGVAVDRVGLPGVQDKVSAAMLSLPLAAQGRRYLLKLSPPEFPHLVENEAFFLDAARRCRILAAEAEVVTDGEGRTGLLVTRFDRTPAGPLAFEDGLQVLGRWPKDKYVLTSEEVCTALAGATGAPLVAARELLRRHVFAYLTLNGDAHAKNWGVLQGPDGEWRVSPAYDVPSSYPYGDSSMATTLGGRSREDITRATFRTFGAALGVPERAVDKAVTEMRDRADAWLPRLDELPFTARTLHKMRRAVEHRLRALA